MTLTGAAEVPGPRDHRWHRNGEITLNHGQGEVCYELTVDKIAAANAAHIHSGAVDKAGPPIANLTPQLTASQRMRDARQRQDQGIMKNPANYYVNVHNAEFPDGAVRGQLEEIRITGQIGPMDLYRTYCDSTSRDTSARPSSSASKLSTTQSGYHRSRVQSAYRRSVSEYPAFAFEHELFRERLRCFEEAETWIGHDADAFESH